MRSVQFSEYGPASVLRVVEVAEPHPGRAEIRIDVRASGVAPGEVLIRSGGVRDVVAVSLPYATGFDAAGVVDEVGEGVSGVAVGDEVFGMATTDTRATNSDKAVLAAWAPKPTAWSWAEAGGAAGTIETFPLTEAAEAHELSETRHARGKIVLVN